MWAPRSSRSLTPAMAERRLQRLRSCATARAFAPLLKHLGGARAPGRAGSRVKIVDGNGLEARAQRRQARREAPGRAVPGPSLVGYAPALGVVTDVVPCDKGQAQAR